MVAMMDFHWERVLTDEIFDKTFEARVHTLLADVTSQNVNVLEVEFLEALSATTQLHTLFQSTRAMPQHYKNMKSVHQFLQLSSIEAKDRGAGHGKTLVEAHHPALACLQDDCGSRLKVILGEEKLNVFKGLLEANTKSTAMEEARKEALQGCGPVFEAAEKTFSFVSVVCMCPSIYDDCVCVCVCVCALMAE